MRAILYGAAKGTLVINLLYIQNAHFMLIVYCAFASNWYYDCVLILYAILLTRNVAQLSPLFSKLSIILYQYKQLRYMIVNCEHLFLYI